MKKYRVYAEYYEDQVAMFKGDLPYFDPVYVGSIMANDGKSAVKKFHKSNLNKKLGSWTLKELFTKRK